MKRDFIQEYWNNQATKFGKSHEASWGDRYMVELEIENIGNYISTGQSVLDVGCANGYAAIRHLQKKLENMIGVDFAERMITEANNAKKETGAQNISFEVGDVRKLQFPDKSFDVVYTTRVLINLPTWEEQTQGIRECIRVAKIGGTVVFSEAFWEPLMLLNALRLLAGLPALVEHDFNRYLKKEKLERLLKDLGYDFKVIDFSSVYYLGTRFLRELVLDSEGSMDFSNPINESFYHLEKTYSGGGMGVQQLFVFKKTH